MKTKELTRVRSTNEIAGKLGATEEIIADMRLRYTGLTADTLAKYEIVRLAIADVRDVRVGVEKSRKYLNSDATDFIKTVNAAAKKATEALVGIETPLKEAKAAIDDAKERERVAKIEEQKRKVAAEIEAARQAEEAERQRLEAERKAEQDRIAAEQADERAKLDAERAEYQLRMTEYDNKIKREQAARDEILRIESEKLAQERAAIEADRAAIEAEKFEETKRRDREEMARQAKIDAEKNAKDAAERAAKDKADRETAAVAEAARLKALQPDADKIRGLVQSLRDIEMPAMQTKDGAELLALSAQHIRVAIDALEFEIAKLEEIAV